jgi:aspartate aminotransferase-like enzyme
MGDTSRREKVLLFLGAFEQCLTAAGHKFSSGASVAAANAVYLKASH